MIEASAGKHSVTTGRTACRSGVAERRPLPAQKRVHQEQMGDRLRRRGGEAEPAAQRQPAEMEREQQLEHEAEPERGQRHARDRTPRATSGRPRCPCRRPTACRAGCRPRRPAAGRASPARRYSGSTAPGRRGPCCGCAATRRDRRRPGPGDSARTGRPAVGRGRTRARTVSHHRLAGVGAGRQARGIAGDQVRDGERQAEQPEEHQAQEGQAPEQVLRQRRIALTSSRSPAGRGRPRR